MPPRIIVNADDLGLCPSVNTAIFDVFRAGNLSSATLMVNMPGTQDAVHRLGAHPGLAVGLHFCITEGRSVVGPSSLTNPDGTFLSRAALGRAALLGRVRPQHVRSELEAQLALIRSLGIRPIHVDGHQHVHMMPVVMDAIMPVLQHEGLAMRIVGPPPGAVRQAGGRLRKRMKQWLNRRLARRAHGRKQVPTNDELVSIHDLDHAGPYDATTYTALLAGTSPGAVVEVMVHPYILGDDLRAMYATSLERRRPFLQRCTAEHEALRHAPVFEGTHLITFDQIQA